MLLVDPVDVAATRWYETHHQRSWFMAELKGSKTHTNLKDAFAGES